jgi:hypothetical protein
VIELREWVSATEFAPKPWLLLGKGPSFTRRHEFPLSDYNLMSLNNAVVEQPVDVAHILDVDVVGACAEKLAENCRFLVMARRPHIKFRPGHRLLEEYFDDYPVLRALSDEGRLVWYNAATSPPLDASPVIGVRYFSSEAALNVLGEMGVTSVRSLGIDGGSGYGQEFGQLQPLGNSLPSFDAQFREIEDIVAARGLDYDTLIEPLRIFVGLDESQIVAARVLEYSIRKHASRPVRFHPMLDIPTPVPKDPVNRGRTGFSFARFHIPRLTGYKGRALYLDADMQVFGDIAALWDIPFGDQKVLCTRQDEPPPEWRDMPGFKPGRQLSVMMLDCSRLDWDVEEIVGGLDEGRYSYEQLMYDLAVVAPDEIADRLPPEWNHLEHYEPGETKLLHYTVVPTQPWKNDKNRLRDIWEREFEEALLARVVAPDEVRRLARLGHVKRALVGALSPLERIKLISGILRSRLRNVLYAAERRIPALRHPRVLQARARLDR